MIRDALRGPNYFDRGIAFKQQVIDKEGPTIAAIAGHEGRIGRAIDLYKYATKLVIQRYSRGDALPDLRPSVVQILELLAVKQSTLATVQLTDKVREMYSRLDLARLYDALTLLAFMAALRMPATDLRRAVELIGHPGEDFALDRVAIECGDVLRTPAERCKFPKVYGGLAEIITASPDQRPAKLARLVKHRYQRTAPISWHDSHQAGEGAYFGYWCFEAALVAIVFNVDDRAVLDHPHYPGDLTRYYRSTSPYWTSNPW